MNARGFTLIEALIAFAILAVVLVALYEAMGTGLKGFDRAAHAGQALMIAQSELDRLAAMKAMPAETQGAVGGTSFHWRIEVLPQTAEPEHLRASPLVLRTVRLVVAWDGGEVAVEKTLLVQRVPGG